MLTRLLHLNTTKEENNIWYKQSQSGGKKRGEKTDQIWSLCFHSTATLALTSVLTMQQWPANRPRCHSDPVDSTSSLLSFGDLDGFERSASETLWDVGLTASVTTGSNNNRAGPCMFTALSQAMASVSCQPHPRLCSSDDLSPMSAVSSSSSLQSFVSSIKASAAVNTSPQMKFTETINGGLEPVTSLVPTSLADVFCSSDEQSESCDAACRSSPDSNYATSPGVTADTTVFDHAG